MRWITALQTIITGVKRTEGGSALQNKTEGRDPNPKLRVCSTHCGTGRVINLPFKIEICWYKWWCSNYLPLCVTSYVMVGANYRSFRAKGHTLSTEARPSWLSTCVCYMMNSAMFQMSVSEKKWMSLHLNVAEKRSIRGTLKCHDQKLVVKECRSSKCFPHGAFLFLFDRSGSRYLGWKKLGFILESWNHHKNQLKAEGRKNKWTERVGKQILEIKNRTS